MGRRCITAAARSTCKEKHAPLFERLPAQVAGMRTSLRKGRRPPVAMAAASFPSPPLGRGEERHARTWTRKNGTRSSEESASLMQSRARRRGQRAGGAFLRRLDAATRRAAEQRSCRAPLVARTRAAGRRARRAERGGMMMMSNTLQARPNCTAVLAMRRRSPQIGRAHV